MIEIKPCGRARRWIGLFIVMTLGVSPSVAAEVARGIVFEDANTNGRFDAGESGVAGVAVSNQDEVVLTDAEGRYEVPLTDDTIIYVTKPVGYRVPLDRNRLPQFYYIHRPAGSPPMHYPGVAPTGPLPDSVDFPLVRRAESDRFSVIAMADPQPETGQEIQYIRDDVFSELVGTEAAFAIVLGDIMSDRLELYDGYNDAAGRIGVELHNVIGNHDMNYDAADDRDSDDTFHRHFGPNYYSWDYAQVHFIVLDTVEWKGPGQGGGNYVGAVGERQRAWLANDLAVVPEDRLIVLSMHIPPSVPDGLELRDLDKLFDLMKDRRRVLALSGHTHRQEHMFYSPDDGWQGRGVFHHYNVGTVSGAWWSGPKDVRGIPVSPCRDGVPNGYAIVSFDGTDYTTDYRGAGFDREARMRIYPPGTTSRSDEARRTVIVNVYDGSVRSQVAFSLDERPFVAMRQTPMVDPFAAALLEGVLKSGKSWVSPGKPTHLWSASLDKPLRGGTHKVTIRVTDHYGRTYEQSRIFVP